MKATLFAIALFSLAAVSKAGALETLETPSYKITNESRCPEGDVMCDEATLTNLVSGDYGVTVYSGGIETTTHTNIEPKTILSQTIKIP